MPQKLKKIIELPCDPGSLLLGNSVPSSKDIYTPYAFAASFTTARKWKQPSCPSTGEYIMKIWKIILSWLLISLNI